jgi:hypothetical protein
MPAFCRARPTPGRCSQDCGRDRWVLLACARHIAIVAVTNRLNTDVICLTPKRNLIREPLTFTGYPRATSWAFLSVAFVCGGLLFCGALGVPGIVAAFAASLVCSAIAIREFRQTERSHDAEREAGVLGRAGTGPNKTSMTQPVLDGPHPLPTPTVKAYTTQTQARSGR